MPGAEQERRTFHCGSTCRRHATYRRCISASLQSESQICRGGNTFDTRQECAAEPDVHSGEHNVSIETLHGA